MVQEPTLVDRLYEAGPESHQDLTHFPSVGDPSQYGGRSIGEAATVTPQGAHHMKKMAQTTGTAKSFVVAHGQLAVVGTGVPAEYRFPDAKTVGDPGFPTTLHVEADVGAAAEATEADTTTVSYTHLTLPTICSV